MANELAPISRRYVFDKTLLSRGGAKWLRAREALSGTDVLCIEARLGPGERRVLDEADEALSAWPAFARPLSVEASPYGTTVVAYAEVAATIAEAVKAGPLGEEQARVVGLEVLDLLDAAHARGVVHPGIDPVSLVVTFDPIEYRPRALLRGLGLPSGARAPQDDVEDVARCLTRLISPADGARASGVRWEETRLGVVLLRALGQPENRFESARAMREALVPPRTGKRVRQVTNVFASSGRVQSDLILASTTPLVADAVAPAAAPSKRRKAARWGALAALAAALVAFAVGRGLASQEPSEPAAVVSEPTVEPVTPVARPPQPTVVVLPLPSLPAPEVVKPEAPRAPAPAVAAAEPVPEPKRETTPAETRKRAEEPKRISDGAKPAPEPERSLAAASPVVAAASPAAAPPAAAPPVPAAPAPAKAHESAAFTAPEPAASIVPPATSEAAASDAVLNFGAGMNRPLRISGRDPVYTAQARELRSEGTMIVRCVIERDGRADACRVLKSVPYMDAAVLEAFATHRYTPILKDGRPARVSYTFNFRLEAP